MAMLSVSVVTFFPDLEVLSRTLQSLDAAISVLRSERPDYVVKLHVIDNSVDQGVYSSISGLVRDNCVHARASTSRMARNLGYGGGHNVAINAETGEYHLVLNPDVLIDSRALCEAIFYLESHPGTALLAPRVRDENDRPVYLSRAYPSILDLLLRGFAPGFICHWFDARLARYELRDQTRDMPFHGVQIASGCFMFLRGNALRESGGFDARYFMYFEDYDLCMRIRQQSDIAYVPNVRIIHFGGDAARKGWKHIRMFSVSAIRFFNRWGWKWI